MEELNDFTALISFYMKSARYRIPQENDPYSTQILLATFYLSKMSTTQTAISLSMLSIVKILLYQLFILQKNRMSLCKRRIFLMTKTEHWSISIHFLIFKLVFFCIIFSCSYIWIMCVCVRHNAVCTST